MEQLLRPLGAGEKAFWILDQVYPVHFVMGAVFAGSIDKYRLIKALDGLQKRHPLLNAFVDPADPEFPVFRKHSDKPVPLRCISDGELEIEMAAELALPFDPEKDVPARVVLISGNKGSKLVLVLEHVIGDGLSGLYILNDLLFLLSGSSRDPLPTPPSIDCLLGFPLRCNDGVSLKEGSVFRRNKITVPQISLLDFSKELTNRIIKRSRLKETSVHGAICAALVIACRQLSNEWAEKPIRITTPVSYRQALRATDEVALYFGAKTLTFETFEESSFWEMARNVKQELSGTNQLETIKREYLPMQDWLYSGLSLSQISEGLQASVIPREFMLSNVGQWPFSTNYGNIQLKSIYGPLALSGYPGEFTVGVVTTNEMLTLSLATRADVKKVLEIARQILDIVC